MDSDLDVTAAASLPTEQCRDSSQVENVLSSKRHHSTSVGRRTRRELNKNEQEGNKDGQQVHRAPENHIETPEGDKDEKQVHRAPKNHIETPEGDKDEEQVYRAPENCIETPEGDRDHEQVQRHPESHMQATGGRNSCRQVPRGAANHLQAQRSVGRNRDPSSQLLQWN